MQDSSTNPYIPQESQEIRHKTETLHSPLGRVVKIALIVTGVLLVLVAAGLVFLIPRTSYEDKQARIDLGNVVQPSDQLAKLVPVKSTLGFSLQYDNLMFTSSAKTPDTLDEKGKTVAAGATFDNNDLRTPREYDLVRIRPIQSADSTRSAITNPPELEISAEITAKTLKDNETKPDYKDLSKLALFMKLSSDKKLAERNPEDGTTAIVSIDETKPVARKINGIDYQMVRYTTKNENYRVATEKHEDCYYTIQNDIPYAACVTDIRPSSTDAASLNEKLLESLNFEKPVAPVAETTEGTEQQTKVETDKNESENIDEAEEAALITKKPEYNDNAESLKAIAKNQPATVRVGTLYCADLALKVESGDTGATLTDACVGNVATGTIISKDGYIATTGHAVRYDPKAAINGYINFAENQKDMLDRLGRVLDYLVKAKLIFPSDAAYMKTGAQIGDQEALAKIENLGSVIPDEFVTPVKDEYTYAIQPTDKPIVLDRNTGQKPSFAYSDSVLAAKYVASDYDTGKAAREKFDSKVPDADIGLLKLEGAFQNAALGAPVEIKANDNLNVLGFPAYTDSTLLIDKIRNMPVVTNAKVDQTYEREGKSLIQVNTPVVPGNDGAGVYDQQARLVGFGVYGLPYCPDQQCFANGTIRPTTELVSLLEKQNIKLADVSEATTVWHEAVDQYFKGNYAAAAAGFGNAGNLYNFNALAGPLQKLAQSKIGSQGDTSLANQAAGAMIAALIVMTVVTILLTVVFFLQKRRLDSLRVGHYGAATAPTAPAPVYPAQQAQYPVQPLGQNIQAPQQPVTSQQQAWSTSATPDTTILSPQGSAPSQAPSAYQQPPAQYQPQPPQQSAQPSQQTPPEDPFYRQ